MNVAPEIDVTALPADEAEPAKYIQNNLEELARLTTRFRHALSLLHYSFEEGDKPSELAPMPEFAGDFDQHRAAMDEWRSARADFDDYKDRMGEWGSLAARNGVLFVYGFWMVTQAINQLLGKAPVLRARLDLEKRNQANALLLKTFPSIANVRVSAAHPGEIGSTPTDFDLHAMAGKLELGENVKIGGQLSRIMVKDTLYIDNGIVSFVTTINKNLVRCDLTEDSLLALSACTELYWAAFIPAESDSSRFRRE